MLTRRRAIALIGAAPLAGLLASRAAAKPYHRGPVTDHFDGERFFNPGGERPRGFGDVLRWQLGGGRVDWPDAYPSAYPADRPPPRVEGGALRGTFVGHATFLIQAGGLNILTDPHWSARASPFGFAGPKRVNPPGIAFDDLPRIDAVLVSHNHYDHLDMKTIARLWRRDRPLMVAPLGNDRTIARAADDVAVTTADWGDTVPLGATGSVTLEPAHHWSARGLGDRNRALWCSFVIRASDRVVYFAGDTGFAGGRWFRHVADRHPRIDLALIPIGAYEPRWFMAPQHINPDEAVQAFELLGAAHALGCHWGTFPLTNEGVDQPSQDLGVALGQRRVAPERFLAARPGQVWTGGPALAAGGPQRSSPRSPATR